MPIEEERSTSDARDQPDLPQTGLEQQTVRRGESSISAPQSIGRILLHEGLHAGTPLISSPDTLGPLIFVAIRAAGIILFE